MKGNYIPRRLTAHMNSHSREFYRKFGVYFKHAPAENVWEFLQESKKKQRNLQINMLFNIIVKR